jgi:MFS transporter, AAHS family, 4-hydroxybenzoate transporter
LLWVAFFCNLLVMYFLVNWLPSLLKQSGYPLDAAIYATSTLNAGGVLGGIVLGRMIDRMGPYVILGSCYGMAALFIGVVAGAGGNPWVLYPSLFLVGIGVVGAQIGINAVASTLYPTGLRSTGIGWALGVGRLGSILGPTVGGLLLAQGWAPNAILQVSLWPALVASLAVFALGAVVARRVRVGRVAEASA